MRRTKTFLASVGGLLLAATLAAQEQATVARIYTMQPKPGMTTQFEQGLKRHNTFHQKQNDSFAWFTWQVETGDRTGTYIRGTFGHRWKDFDDWSRMEAADTADGAINLDPSTAPGGTSSFYLMRTDLSRPEDGPTPSPMAHLIHWLVKPASEAEFNANEKKIYDAIVKTSWPQKYAIYELLNGGEGATFVLSIPLKSWAGMQGPELPFPAMLEKAYGKVEAERLMAANAATLRAPERSEVIRYRADLSYLPAAAK
jgi:hypothetical protein